MRFVPLDAAFEGFRVTRRHPVAVLAWAAVMLAANVLSGVAVGLLAGPAWADFQALAVAKSPPDPAVAATLLPKIGSALFVSLVIQIIGAAVVHASVLRALLRPERRAWLALGRDEMRVAGLLGMYFVVNFAASLVLSLGLGLFSRVIGEVALAIAPLASLAVFTILTVRFSLAGPATIAEHRFHFGDTWSATRPWFWPLLSAEVLAGCFALVVGFLALVVFISVAGAILTLQGGSLVDVVHVITPDFTRLDRIFAPAPMLYVAYMSILYAMLLVIMIAPPVELYRALHQPERD